MKYFLFILLLFPLCLMGQVSVGTGLEKIDSDGNVFGVNGNYFYRVSMVKESIYIRKCDVNSMKVISSKTIEGLPKDYSLEGVICIKGRVYFFYTQAGGDDLYSTVVDLENERLTSKAVVVVSPGSKVLKERNGNIYGMQASADSSKFLFSYAVSPAVKSDKKSYQKIGVSVCDVGLKKLWTGELEMPQTEEAMGVLSYIVDSKGAVCILARIDKESSGKVVSELCVLKYTAQSKTATSLDIKGKKSVTSFIKESADNNVVVVSYLTENRGKDAAGAIAVFRVDANNKTILSSKITDLSVETCNQFSSEKDRAKNTKNGFAAIPDFYLNGMEIQADGSVIVWGEQYKYEWVTNSEGKQKLIEYYNDALLMKIDASNNISWAKRLAKKQTNKEISRGSLSVQYLKVGSNHFLLYLDNKKNLTTPATEEPAQLKLEKDGYVRAFKVTESGESSMVNLFDRSNVNGKTIPYYNPISAYVLSGYGIISEAYCDQEKTTVLVKAGLK